MSKAALQKQVTELQQRLDQAVLEKDQAVLAVQQKDAVRLQARGGRPRLHHAAEAAAARRPGGGSGWRRRRWRRQLEPRTLCSVPWNS